MAVISRRLSILALLVASGCALIGAPPPVAFASDVEWTANDGAVLAGTLTLPPGPGPHPAVVLIGGAAERDRDQTIVGFATFKVLADHLGRHGVAVLRYDDRGTGRSSGGRSDDAMDLATADALAAVRLLRANATIDARRIGVLGHGEGAIAAVAAARSVEVAYVVLLAGICIPIEELWLDVHETELTLRDAPRQRILEGRRQLRALFAAVRAGDDTGPVEEALLALAELDFDELPAEQRAALGSVDAYFRQTFEGRLLRQADADRFTAHLALDPTPDLRSLRKPILALFGGKDLTVNAAGHAAALREAARAAGNDEVEIETYPDANHVFQRAVTGAPNEYASLRKEYVDGLLDRITAWIRSRPAPRPGR